MIILRATVCVSLLFWTAQASGNAFLWIANAPYRQVSVTADLPRLCSRIEDAASEYKVPPPLIARLIWQESNFDVDAVDTRGRLGIAKISFKTTLDDVTNPFDPLEAVGFLAGYLSVEKRKLGNFGLAVAAYDVGEAQLRRRQALPWQTQNLVYEAAGYPSSAFLQGGSGPGVLPLAGNKSFLQACELILARKRDEQTLVSRERKWFAMVAGSWSREIVERQWSAFAQRHDAAAQGLTPLVQRWVSPLGRAGVYAAKVYTNERREADQICARLHKAGSQCIVLRN